MPALSPFAHNNNAEPAMPLFDICKKAEAFEAEFPKVFWLLDLAGAHPVSNKRITDPFTGRVAEESFANVGVHSMLVAEYSLRIGRPLVAAGALQRKDLRLVAESALLHDLLKPLEVFERRAKLGSEMETAQQLSPQEHLRRRALKCGADAETLHLIEKAGLETGHLSLSRFIHATNTGSLTLIPERLPEKIVHLVDDMTATDAPKGGHGCTTRFLTPRERIFSARFAEKYPSLWIEGLGVNPRCQICEVPDVGRPPQGIKVLGNFIKLQIQVAYLIASEIQRMNDPADSNDAIAYIQHVVSEDVILCEALANDAPPSLQN